MLDHMLGSDNLDVVSEKFFADTASEMFWHVTAFCLVIELLIAPVFSACPLASDTVYTIFNNIIRITN